MEINQYGDKYWCVRLISGELIYFHADELTVSRAGALISKRHHQDPTKQYSLLSFGPGQWSFFYAASVLDGDPVCVQHWDTTNHKQISVSYGRKRDKISPSVRLQVFKRDSYKCKICGAKSDDGSHLVVDHITPVSRGGTSSIRNLQTLCDPCNAGKAAK